MNTLFSSFRLFLLLLLSWHATPVWACNSHPTMTHEQWTSYVEDQRDAKSGAVLSTTSSFWEKNKPEANTSPATTSSSDSKGKRTPSRGKGVRRIRQ